MMSRLVKFNYFFKKNDIQEVLCVDKIDSKYLEINQENLKQETDTRLYLEGFNLIKKLTSKNSF